jgi:3-deoxy-D-manno-octulosonic-acid transferase
MQERYGIASVATPDAPVIWLHAASVGEAQSVLPLLQQLRAAKPDYHFLITTGTVTSAAMLERHLHAGMTHQFIPLDIPAYVARFLQHWKPVLALWVESEFWPNLLRHTHAAGIPMMLVNARISERSAARWARFPDSIQTLLGCFSAMFAGSEKDASRLTELGGVRVQYAGNIKSDAAPLPVDPVALTLLERGVAKRPFWLAASTHDGEEAMIAATHKALAATITGLLTIIAPRHPARGPMIAAELSTMGLRVARRSAQQKITADTDIYLADTMGELGTFYHLAPVALIGGSLIPHGGHNPLEAARHDCAVITGPHIHNFEEIYHELKAERAVTIVADTETLARALQHGFETPDIHTNIAAKARHYVDAKHGATQMVIDRAIELLQDHTS